MQPFDLKQLRKDVHDFDRLVLDSPHIDLFCSSAEWILAASSTLCPFGRPFMFRNERGCIAMTLVKHQNGARVLQPLEAFWCLASPLIGHDIHRLIESLIGLLKEHSAAWDVAVISGIPIRSPAFLALSSSLAAQYKIRFGPPSRRCVGDIGHGMEKYWALRSANLRRSVRRSLKVSQAAGISIENCIIDSPQQADQLFDRIVAVESQSWKGVAGVGINMPGDFGEFYRVMNRGLVTRGFQRTMFARHKGRDIGYIHGAVFSHTYRGLQFSFEAEYRRFGLGNLLQYSQIGSLIDEGIKIYDLGTDMAYKQRWADYFHDTVMLVVYQ